MFHLQLTFDLMPELGTIWLVHTTKNIHGKLIKQTTKRHQINTLFPVVSSGTRFFGLLNSAFWSIFWTYCHLLFTFLKSGSSGSWIVLMKWFSGGCLWNTSYNKVIINTFECTNVGLFTRFRFQKISAAFPTSDFWKSRWKQHGGIGVFLGCLAFRRRSLVSNLLPFRECL